VNGGPVSPNEAFRLALQGHVRRIVLGAAETSVSRKARLFTGPLRKLLDIRDGECTWVSCDRPPSQGGHGQPWRDDGPTTAENGGLECGPHNRFTESLNDRPTQLPNLARPQRPMAHLPPRRHRSTTRRVTVRENLEDAPFPAAHA
jgi:hypothetical protein